MLMIIFLIKSSRPCLERHLIKQGSQNSNGEQSNRHLKFKVMLPGRKYCFKITLFEVRPSPKSTKILCFIRFIQEFILLLSGYILKSIFLRPQIQE